MPIPIRLDYSQISKPKKKRAAPAKPKTTSNGSFNPAATRRLEQEAIRKNFAAAKKAGGVGSKSMPSKRSLGKLGEERWNRYKHAQDMKTFSQGGSGAIKDPKYKYKKDK